MKQRSVLSVCAAATLALSTLAVAQPRMSAWGGKTNSGQDECRRACHSAVKELISGCLAEGIEPRECAARGHEFAQRCRRQCDEPRQCEDKCKVHAHSVLENCLADGGTQEECEAKAREAHHRCVMEHCTPPGGCEEACRRHAVDAFKECLAAGVSESECIERARGLFHDCVDQHCNPPPDCRDRCRQDAGMVEHACLENGGTEERCSALAEEFFTTCVRDHCTPPTCEEACTRRAVQLHRECLENGGSAEDCAVRARAFLTGCIDHNCEPAPTCEERCQRLARNALAMCLQLGGSPEQCEARAQEVLSSCVEDNCTEPPTCEDRCTRQARHLYQECIATGGSNEDCEARAHEALAACIEEHCQPSTGCEELCHRIAGLVSRLCLQLGGSEDTCTARAHNFLESCLDPHCDPATCRALCHLESHKIFLKCMAGGGNEEECTAHANEALEACLQACSRPHCGGIAGIPCPDGQFCLFEPGTCEVSDRAGACVPIPEACPAVFEPVCGCDGVTYGNRCEAAMAQQSIAHEGPCRAQCGGIAGIPCEDGEFCKFPPGTCHLSDNQGLCVPFPVGCPDVWNPVCSCDGMTYSNECDADAAGVSIDHHGPCESACSGNDACVHTQFCRFAVGDCGEGEGVCTNRPVHCPAVYDPVCGCNGETYGNACQAAMSGVSIRHEGPCLHPACESNEQCEDSAFCMFRLGDCGEHPGECERRPDACPEVYSPVCGCDGQTYANRCFAHKAGASVAYEGSCAEVCGGIAGIVCQDEGDYCHFRIGTCGEGDVQGVCREKPGACPLIHAPVCACDGNTYGNACLAAQAGMSLAHEGPCRDGGCQFNSDCDDGRWCRFADGACGKHAGECIPRPMECPNVYDPVCGCDGQAYANRCRAAQAGVSVVHAGECD